MLKCKYLTMCMLAIFLGELLHAQPATSQLFSDDIWYFGQAVTTAPGSQGVRFVRNSLGKMVPQDASGVAKVSSYENTLSVSTPACNGGFVFYIQHNRVYNSQHEVMENGSFEGNSSVADGLACCYMGNNKYYLFAVNQSYNGTGIPIALKYYEIDMNAEAGLGKLVQPASNTIESTGMAESIELVAKSGTQNEYWLTYHHLASNTLKVALVTPSGITAHSSVTLPKAGGTYTLKSRVVSSTLAYLVLASYGAPQSVQLFSLNPTTGAISYTKSFSYTGSGGVYGVELSPSGKYLYAAGWNGNTVLQFNVSTGASTSLVYSTTHTSNHYGGGMKLAPDGRIYIARGNSYYLAVLTEPDMPMTTSNLLVDGFRLSVLSLHTLQLSAGLTPPAIDPPSATNPPVAVNDEAATLVPWPVAVNVLANDQNNNGTRLYVDNAFFTDPSKAAQGTISYHRENGTITFTPSLSYMFTDGEQVHITYVAKDNGTPIPLCENAQLTITVRLPRLSLKLSSTAADEGSTVTATVCLPNGFVAPTGGFSFALNRLSASTAAEGEDYEPLAISYQIPQGQQCIAIPIVVKSDKLVEGTEHLSLQPSAQYFTGETATLTIADKTVGKVIVKDVADHAQEYPIEAGIFTLCFDSDVRCTRDVTVSFSLTGANDAYIAVPLTATIVKHTPGVDITITPKNNYVVEGARPLKLTIQSVSIVDN